MSWSKKYLLNNPELIHINIDKILRESEKAILVAYCGQEIWLPKKEVRIEKRGMI